MGRSTYYQRIVQDQRELVVVDEEEQTVSLPAENSDGRDEVQRNNGEEQPETIEISRERPVRTKRRPARFRDFNVTWKYFYKTCL